MLILEIPHHDKISYLQVLEATEGIESPGFTVERVPVGQLALFDNGRIVAVGKTQVFRTLGLFNEERD